eukprot:525324_1
MTCCVDDNKLNNCISISLPICILLFLIWINFDAVPPGITHNDIEIDTMHANSSNPPSLSPMQMIETIAFNNNNNTVDNIDNNTYDNTYNNTYDNIDINDTYDNTYNNTYDNIDINDTYDNTYN